MEFERNIGDPEDVVFTGDMIGYPQCLDHVGIRVQKPAEAFLWYAEKLGFVQNILEYKPNPEALKNFTPWISRTLSHCDINLIINASERPPENILIAENIMRPGLCLLTKKSDVIKKCYHSRECSDVIIERAGMS